MPAGAHSYFMQSDGVRRSARIQIRFLQGDGRLRLMLMMMEHATPPHPTPLSALSYCLL
jgi:hypothetical protein